MYLPRDTENFTENNVTVLSISLALIWFTSSLKKKKKLEQVSFWRNLHILVSIRVYYAYTDCNIPYRYWFYFFFDYFSGSTGKPKGVLHTVGGYLLYTATTFKYVFDYKPNDVYFCTADVGWITGHSYVVYGPLANGATSVIVSGLLYIFCWHF